GRGRRHRGAGGRRLRDARRARHGGARADARRRRRGHRRRPPRARPAARRGDGRPARRARPRPPPAAARGARRRRHAPPDREGRAPMSTTTALVVGLVLLAGNAFFVGAEFAVISARRSAIEPLAQAGDRRAVTVLWAMEHVSLMLACAQLGVTVCSTGLGIVAEPALAHLLEGPLHALGMSEDLTHPIALVVALSLAGYLHVVLGEMVPKNLAVAGPDRAVMWCGPPLVLLGRALRPVIAALNWIANHAVRLAGVEPKDEVAS